MKNADLLRLIPALRSTTGANACSAEVGERMALVWDLLRMVDEVDYESLPQVDALLLAMDARMKKLEDAARKNAIHACERALAKLA